MRLADFIQSNVEPILAEWEVFARSMGAGEHLDRLRLRDHAGEILKATARDMMSTQSGLQRADKSKGLGLAGTYSDALDGASDLHAVDRLSLGFDMLEVMSEYRALRASVLRLWRESAPGPDDRDIDDLTRFNESIDQSLAQAVATYTTRVDQARDMFLGILSHDLRNPLNAIAMTAAVVSHVANDPDEALECSRQITRSVSVMERMISDLLDYTRTRLKPGLPVKPVALDLATLAREAFEEIRSSSPERQFDFTAKGDLHGQWDADRVRQAISNLMGNAVQHGAPGSPITLSLRGDASDVSITVHNGGNPIPSAELHALFDPLVRGSGADHSGQRGVGSLGLGLYIAREVAKSHGGDVGVISNAEHGTAFTLQLPRQPPPSAGGPTAAAGSTQKTVA